MANAGRVFLKKSRVFSLFNARGRFTQALLSLYAVTNDYAERLTLDQVGVLWNKNHSLQHASHLAWFNKTDQASVNE